jgi:hypothetical protein
MDYAKIDRLTAAYERAANKAQFLEDVYSGLTSSEASALLREIDKVPAAADYYTTARMVDTGEFVAVKHIGDGHYRVTFQSGSTAMMPAEQDGHVYLDRFTF